MTWCALMSSSSLKLCWIILTISILFYFFPLKTIHTILTLCVVSPAACVVWCVVFFSQRDPLHLYGGFLLHFVVMSGLRAGVEMGWGVERRRGLARKSEDISSCFFCIYQAWVWHMELGWNLAIWILEFRVCVRLEWCDVWTTSELLGTALARIEWIDACLPHSLHPSVIRFWLQAADSERPFACCAGRRVVSYRALHFIRFSVFARAVYYHHVSI